MANEAPFFSAGLLVTAPDGTYGGIRKSVVVAAFDDRLEIAGASIYYQYLTGLRVYGNVLQVSYVASDGRQVDHFFKFNTFLPRKGARLLAEMATRVESARAAVVKPSVWKPEIAQVAPAIRAEMLEPSERGWQRVAIYSALVAFPAVCPVCTLPADTIAPFQVSAGLNQKGSWLVPVCASHAHAFTAHIGFANWRADVSRFEVNIWNREYAKQFLLVNAGENPEQVRRQAESSPLLVAIKNGIRLVQFQFTVSALVISLMLPSKIHVLKPQQSALVAGLRYSLLSAVTGWWSIAGLIWTPAVIIRNSRGGIDLTKTAAAVLRGSAMSAGGFR